MMQVNFNSINRQYGSKVSFNGRIENLMDTIKNAEDCRHLKVSVEQAISIYQQLKFIITRKSGSHITITAPNGLQYALTIPHGSGKRYLSGWDVRRLKYAINNDYEGLKNSIKI